MLGQNGGKTGQIRRVEFLVFDHGRVGIGGLHRFDEFIAGTAFHQVFGVDQRLPGEFDVLRGKRFTVAPFDAFFELVGDGQPVRGDTAVIDAGNLDRQDGYVFPLVVYVYQVLGKRLVDVGNDGLHADVRVERFRLLVDTDGHDIFGGRRRRKTQQTPCNEQRYDT